MLERIGQCCHDGLANSEFFELIRSSAGGHQFLYDQTLMPVTGDDKAPFESSRFGRLGEILAGIASGYRRFTCRCVGNHGLFLLATSRNRAIPMLVSAGKVES